MATLREPKGRERSLSQPDEKISDNALIKKRHTVADVGVAVTNMRRIAKAFCGGDNDANEVKRPDTEGVSLNNLITRRLSGTSDNKSDITKASEQSTLRRRSTFRGLATSITSMIKFRMLTTIKKEPSKPKIRYENTYRMSLNTGNHVAIHRTEEEAGKVLEEMIGGRPYNHRTSGDLSRHISNKIKERVKALNFPRYRIVVQVTISQANSQGLEVASRCVWDSTADNYACVTYRNDTTVAIVLIYGVYLE